MMISIQSSDVTLEVYYGAAGYFRAPRLWWIPSAHSGTNNSIVSCLHSPSWSLRGSSCLDLDGFTFGGRFTIARLVRENAARIFDFPTTAHPSLHGDYPGVIDSLDGPSFSQERYRSAFRMRLVLKPQCVPERRAFNDFIRPVIMSREFHTHPEVGATLHQQLRHR